MFEGKNKRRSKVFMHVMSYALVFALFNHWMTPDEDEFISQAQERQHVQAQAQAQEQAQEQVDAAPEAVVAQTAEELQAAVDDEDIEIIELAYDIELEQTLTVPYGDVTINGNGHYIIWPYVDAPAIEIGAGAALTLADVTLAGQNEGYGSNLLTLGGRGVVVSGMFTMGGGSVVQGFAVGVQVDGGGLVLDGGAITGNGDASPFGRGGGVRLNGGDFVMHDGIIANNTARTGGGMFVSGPAFIEINGGEIRNNSAETGGGVFLEPINPYQPYDRTIIVEIGAAAENAIFDNSSDNDIRWVEGGPGIQGIVINDLEDFIENFDPDDSGNLILLLYEDDPDERTGEEPPAPEGPRGEPGGEFEEPPQEEYEPDIYEPGGQPQEDEPYSGLADLKATNPQTGDEFSFLGLVMSAAGLAMSIFLLLVYREREKLEKARPDAEIDFA